MILPAMSCAYDALEQVLSQHKDYTNKLSTQIFKSVQSQRHIEINKSNIYQVFAQAGISIPPSQIFKSVLELKTVADCLPCVIKFDAGTTLGIQTIVAQTPADYKQVLHSIQQTHTHQGIVQQFVSGPEHTVTVLVGKHNWIVVGYSQDYKKQFDLNQGPNTFGLGSITVAPSQTDDIIDQVVDTLQQTYQYQGLLSCQFIQDLTGKFWLLECNTRLCDPEFQSIAENLDASVFTALTQCYNNEIIDPITIGTNNAVTIGLIHQAWPTHQVERPLLEIANDQFKIYQHQGRWDCNTYWGSITNSGTRSHQDLAQEIYNWLDTVNVTPYRYRKDIGK